jgi:hypothetical protein
VTFPVMLSLSKHEINLGNSLLMGDSKSGQSR